MTKLKTTSQFIADAKAIHGDKYDYSKVEYNGNKNPVCIICPTHGEFWQTPNTHLKGSGCRHCYTCSKTKFGCANFNIPNACSNKEPYYKVWHSILVRTLYTPHKRLHPAYNDCTICDEWLNLSNFRDWFENPENGYLDGLQIDKDILVKGNKVYSPDTCCFVPREINAAISFKHKGKCPIIGVKVHLDKFETSISRYGNRVYLGIFDTVEEAFYAYKAAKEQYIKELAEKYFHMGKITERVYNALMKYEVDIND
jgi:hypothetical protein